MEEEEEEEEESCVRFVDTAEEQGIRGEFCKVLKGGRKGSWSAGISGGVEV